MKRLLEIMAVLVVATAFAMAQASGSGSSTSSSGTQGSSAGQSSPSSSSSGNSSMGSSTTQSPQQSPQDQSGAGSATQGSSGSSTGSATGSSGAGNASNGAGTNNTSSTQSSSQQSGGSPRVAAQSRLAPSWHSRGHGIYFDARRPTPSNPTPVGYHAKRASIGGFEPHQLGLVCVQSAGASCFGTRSRRNLLLLPLGSTPVSHLRSEPPPRSSRWIAPSAALFRHRAMDGQCLSLRHCLYIRRCMVRLYPITLG
jgi:hypothetical protein